ncbi:hypothetical protein HDA32_002420 [Spinactinospora alkalitolerans]|uniref:DUF4267 domain-containing protein n=1 Tax=Spinactinospora alkalitolerans TaxID=687207 RepID=A0A852TZU6_9ACTN|nr:hypothetical protein [Spinactinospora alkalitolerans]NYE47300.1 hypothetical protein [Spinactinospora alkalitolerans]
MPRLARTLGLVTAGYSAAITVRPELLARPCGLVAGDGRAPAPVRTLISAIGVRDTAIGLAMALAPEGRPLRVAIAARVAADAGDAVVFGLGLPDRGARRKVAAFASAWAGLCAFSAR